jgi:poly-gamma-glutamate synthesis protein (capsule biosynthesis protein)
MLGEDLHCFGRGIPTQYWDEYENLIDRGVRRRLMHRTDVLIGNLECSLATDEEFTCRRMCNGAFVAPMRSLRVFSSGPPYVAVSIANNHFSQYGKKAARGAKREIADRGFYVIGQDSSPVTLAVGTSRLLIWGVSLIHDPFYCGEYFLSTAETLLSDLKLPRKAECDRWVLAIHWGEEYSTLHSKLQLQTAKALAQLGFDLILGHHPHVAQPVQLLSEGACVVYSHGNFIADQAGARVTRTGLAVRHCYPEGTHEVFLTEQKDFVVCHVRPVTLEELDRQCRRYSRRWMPLICRLSMKVDVLRHPRMISAEMLSVFGQRFGRRLIRK